jgi:hydroxypyruvate reductase
MLSETDELLKTMRSEILQLFEASLVPVNPYETVKRSVRAAGDILFIGQGDQSLVKLDLDGCRRIFIVGGGKAAAPMARAIEEILGARISEGYINVKYGFTEELGRTEIVEAGHPLPDQSGVEGTGKILRLIEGAGEKDLIFSLISGGGSALLPSPAGDISLEEKQAVTNTLLKCGASIDEINAIRKHISSSKGGQMARAAYPATVVNLMLSDVVGDRMDVIASGPFVPDMTTFEEAWNVFEKYGIEEIPVSVKERFKKGVEGIIPDTPKAGEKIFERVYNFIVGSNILALEAARQEAESIGYNTLIISSMIEGESSDVARVHTAIAREILKTGRPIKPPACIISGGETTVTVKGTGQGGRNQEFCLVAAMGIADMSERVVILSGGTDGNDGPTDAAGGIVDPLTLARGRALGMQPFDYLENNDSYNYLKKAGDLLVTGPTNTNVMDVRIVLVR